MPTTDERSRRELTPRGRRDRRFGDRRFGDRRRLLVGLAAVLLVPLVVLSTGVGDAEAAARPYVTVRGQLVPGAVVRLVGRGFPRSATLTVRFDRTGAVLRRISVGSGGTFSVTTRLPRTTRAGGHRLYFRRTSSSTILYSRALSVHAPRIYAVPSSIDGTGRSDVSGPLQAFFDRVPNGATIRLGIGKRYRVEATLKVFARRISPLMGGARPSSPGTTRRRDWATGGWANPRTSRSGT